MLVSKKGGFLDDKNHVILLWSKSLHSFKRDNSWFSSKIPVIFGAYFSVKETSVFSFDDVVLSKGSFLTIKLPMWEARGVHVGTYSKTYPGKLGLKCIFLPLIINFSFWNSYNVKFKIQLVQYMNLKVFKVSLKTPDVITKKREARIRITGTTGKFAFKFVETIWGIVATMDTMIIESITRIRVFKYD